MSTMVLPPNITLDITDRCNLRCQTCSKWKVNRNKAKESELSTDEWKRVLSELASWANNNDSTEICFSGGEPFLREDLFELASHAKAQGLQTAVISNGYATLPLVDKIIESDIDTLTVSLNSVKDKRIHDASRGIEGSCERVISLVTELSQKKNSGNALYINAILSLENMSEYVHLFKFAKRLKAGLVFNLIGDTSSFHPYLLNKSSWVANYELPDELKEKYASMRKRLPFLLCQLFLLKMQGYQFDTPSEDWRAIRGYLKDPNGFIADTPCLVGSKNLAIDPYGNVRLCFNMPPIGNVREQSIQEIYCGEKAEKCREMIETCTMHCRVLKCNDSLNS